MKCGRGLLHAQASDRRAALLLGEVAVAVVGPPGDLHHGQPARPDRRGAESISRLSQSAAVSAGTTVFSGP